jgi:hypothetical protein
MPHVLVGIGAIGYWFFLLFWSLFGTDLKAVVTDTSTSHSSKGGTTYSIKYEFKVGDQTHSGSDGVSQALYEKYKGQDDPRPEVTVRFFAIGPLDHAELLTGKSKWGSLGFMTLWTGFWNSITGIFVYMLWIRPLQVRKLYKYGEATDGTLIGKRVSRGKKSTTYYATYTFRHPQTGTEIKREITVWNTAAWNVLMEGQEITVLYDPQKPARSTIYELGGYEVKLSPTE